MPSLENTLQFPNAADSSSIRKPGTSEFLMLLDGVCGDANIIFFWCDNNRASTQLVILVSSMSLLLFERSNLISSLFSFQDEVAQVLVVVRLVLHRDLSECA